MHSPRGPLLAVALLAMLGMAWSLDAPLLMWSGSNYFSGKNVQIQNTVASSQFQAILTKMVSGQSANLAANIASAFSTEQSNPEVVVLYLEPMLRTDQISSNLESLTRLKKEVSSSKSSVVVPFVALENGENVLVSALSSMVSALPSGAKVLYQGSQRTAFFNQLHREVPQLQILGKDGLKSDNIVFSNRVLDVVIVELTAIETTLNRKLARDDQVIADVQEIVEEATDGNYVALFTSESVSFPAIQTVFGATSSHITVQAGRDTNADDVNVENVETNPNVPKWAAYFPYWFWEGLVYLIIFLIIALFAVCSLCSIQTPTTFLAEKKKND